MKRIFFCSVLLLLSFQGFSQLTTSETISYIDKKLKECTDLQRTYSDSYTYIVTGLGFIADPKNSDKVILSYNRKFSDGTSDELQYVFNPVHISQAVDKIDSYKDGLGMVGLQFISKTAITKQRSNGTTKDIIVDGFTFPYLRTDPLNFERFKKALMHLKQLYTAKQVRDPFVN